MSLFISENPATKESLAKFSAHVYFILLPLAPTLFIGFAFIYIKKLYRNYSQIILALTLLIAGILIWFGNDKDYYDYASIGFYYISDVAYYAHWEQMYMHLAQLIFIFLAGLVSIILIIRYGLVNIDYRVRTNAKIIALTFLIVFLAFIQEQLQLILFREKQFSILGNLMILLGSIALFTLLVKKGEKVFSSPLLAENILENLSYPVTLLDEQGRVVYHNQKMKELTALSSKQLNGTNIYTLLPNLNLTLDDLLGYGQYGIHHIRTELKDAFNNFTNVLISCQSIYGFTGSFQGIIFSLESLDKKPIPEALQKDHEYRIMKAVEASHKGFWDWDIKNGDLYFSKETYQILGYSIEEFPELNFTKWKSLIHPEDVDNYFEKLNENLKGNKNEFLAEYRVQTKSGNWIWLLDQGSVIAFDENNNPSRMSGMFTDISHVKNIQIQLKKSQEKLETTLKLKNKLIDFLSTDIREPFNSIIGLSEVLYLGSDIEEKERKRFLKEILEQSHNSFRLIENILDFSRLDKESPSLRKRNFPINKLVDEVQFELDEKAAQKNIGWESNVNNNIVYTDREILKKILLIIAENLIKHTDANSKIGIETSADNAFLEIKLIFEAHSADTKWLGELLNKTPFSDAEDILEKQDALNRLELLLAKRLTESLAGKIATSVTKQNKVEVDIKIPVNQ